MDLLAIARKITDPVEAESFKQNIPVAVTVIDIYGNVVLTHRMTEAPAFSLGLSERKAYISALVRMRTADLVPSYNQAWPSIPSSPSPAVDTPRWAEACRSPARAK